MRFLISGTIAPAREIPKEDTVLWLLSNLNLIVPVVASVLVIIVAIIVICLLRGKGNYHKGKRFFSCSLQGRSRPWGKPPTLRCCSRGCPNGWTWISPCRFALLLWLSLLVLLLFVWHFHVERWLPHRHGLEVTVCVLGLFVLPSVFFFQITVEFQ